MMFTTASPEFLADPYAAYELLRARDTVLWVPGIFGNGAWVVTSHAVCSSVLRDKRFGKEGEKILAPDKLALILRQGAEVIERRRRSMLFRDPPDHTRLRGLVSQAFTPRTIERLRPRIAEVTEQLIDRVQGTGEMDLIREVAFPLPITMIAELLGVPPEDRDRFKGWSVILTLGLNPGASPETLAEVRVALEALDDYLMGVIEERRRTPRSDLISELVRVHEGTDKLSMDELISTCRLLLTAGHETTVNLIGNGMLALLRHPDQRAALAADASLLSGAIEEFLRYDSPVQMTTRFAYEASALGSHTAQPGDLVVLILGAANRDPATFAVPNELDVRRENAQANLAFGGGVHYCLGAPLARVEGEIAVGALLRRLPELALAKGDLEWRQNVVLRGLRTLPVTF
jgi:pimeloyl-[acyl-carrier protein] synthase